MVHACSAAGDIEILFDRATVIAAGPGLGQGAWSRELLVRCLDDARPLVVDADGLNLLAGMDTARSRWILTPHPAEAARLLECSTPQVQSDRVGAAQALAERYDAVVVLKGCGTVVAGPEGGYAICPLGNPGMATAGSGDVLTGLIAGLWAQGLAAIDAARAGVVAHASAGDAAAAALGQRPMLAGDLNAFLAHVLS